MSNEFHNIKLTNVINVLPFSTMKCFKWETKLCQNTNIPKKCKLRIQDDGNSSLIEYNRGTIRVLESPGYIRKYRGAKNKHLCVYNVSLACTGHKTDLSITERYSRSNVKAGNCSDYVKFYTNSTRYEDVTMCGEDFGDFSTTLNSHSFLAILWTDKVKSQGKFQMIASCGSAIIRTPSPDVEAEDAC